MTAHSILSHLLQSESKTNTYKFALVRALGDLALKHQGLAVQAAFVAVPLRSVAELWMSYYWAFCDPQKPVLQGPNQVRDGTERQDISFRHSLTELRTLAEQLGLLKADPAAGHQVHALLEVGSGQLKPGLTTLYQKALKDIQQAIRKPVEYAGVGKPHSLFPRPAKLRDLGEGDALPEVHPAEVCIAVPAEVWKELQARSRLFELRALMEWSRFIGDLRQEPCDQGEAFRLLTSTPVEPVSDLWEHDQLQRLIQLKHLSECPWSTEPLIQTDFDVDHVIPISILPINEWWNLLPADPRFHRQVKQSRMVDGHDRQVVQGRLTDLFGAYQSAGLLHRQVEQDALSWFGLSTWDPERLAQAVVHTSLQVADLVQAERFRVRH